MSTLLEQASLVMIPSGYKEDVVYSQIPTNGNGDLTFTRASNGTRVNSAGLVEVCPWNLLQYSEDFSNSYWTKDNITITANATTNPVNGQNTATAIIATAVFTYHSLTLASFSSSQPSVISIFVKAGSKSNVEIEFGSGQISFNLSTQTINYQTNATGTIESYGNGWYRISAIVPSCSYIAFIVMPGTGTSEGWTGDGTTTAVYYYGAQLNIGSTAKPYFPTTDRLNVPRLTYQNGGGGCPSLLLEKQSTNLVTYSAQFDNAAWSKQDLTVTANATTSPDGTTNAQKIVPNTTNGTHYIDQFVTISAVDYTYTIYAKKGEYNYLYVNAYSNSSRRTWFDLNSGTVSMNTSPNIATIESVGNGWYRCTITNTSSGTTGAFQFGADINNGTINANPTFSGDGTSGIYVWGAQLEASSYATSYIPTTSSSATRVADACFKTGISSLIGQSEGVVFWDIDVEVLSATGNENLLNIDAGIFGNTIYLFKSATGNLIAEVYVSNVAQCSFSFSLPSVGRYKMALAYKSNDFAFYVNGTQIGTDTSGSVPATSRLQLGNGVLGPSDGKVNQLVLFPTRLTNAELASLTTL